MTTGLGAAGLLWLWAVVAELGPAEPPGPPSRPGSNRDREDEKRLALANH
jgi:hypothetical protein